MSEASEQESDRVHPTTLAEAIGRGEEVAVLDVRDRDAFDAWHVDGPAVDAAQVAYNRVLAAATKDTVRDLVLDAFGDRPSGRITVVCAIGHSSDEAATILRAAGFDAANLAGGMRAWAEVYTAVDVQGYDGPGSLRQYHRPATGCLAYLLGQEDEAAVIDPLRAFADRYVEDAADAGADIAYAVDTHVHADHVSGVRAVAARTDATPLIPAGSRDRGLLFDAAFLESGPIPDGAEAFTVGDATVRALSVPGHTTEMTAFRVGSVLLTGDSLFLNSVARPDLEDGHRARERAGTLYDSIHRLVETLPADTVVAPGHTAPVDPVDDGAFVAELSRLRRALDLLAFDREAFVARIAGNLPPRPTNHERIVATNLGQESLDDGTAREVELGPNNCAATVE